MRKITVSTMTALDGVMGDPQGWGAMSYFDETAALDGLRRLQISDGMLLGRVTYEALAKAWTGRRGPFADRLTAIPKTVFSSTLLAAEWGNATIARGDVVSTVRTLKEGGEGDLVIFGHGRLTKTLLHAGLVDEIRLLIMPVLAGRGELLRADIPPRAMKLVQATTLPSGVIILVHSLA